MSTLRIGGLASGMDTQAIIERILEVQARQITKTQERRVELETNVAVWSNVSADVSLLTDSLFRLRSLNTWRQMDALSSQPTALSASASASADEATYSIAIGQLAQAHSVGSERWEPATDALIDRVPGLVSGNTYTFRIGGAEGPLIEIEEGDTLQTLADKINAASETLEEADAKMQATIVDHRLILTRQQTGATELLLEDVEGSPLEALGILNGLGGWQNELITAQDAEFTVNNAAVVRSSNTNVTDVIAGVTLNLLGETAMAATLTVRNNTETPMAAINDFIANYNVVAEKIEAFSDVDLSDPDNPRAGPLQGDPLTWNILQNMRRLATRIQDELTEDNAAFSYGGQTGVANSLSALGIGMSGRTNRIAIQDESRLSYLLANEFDKVEQVFRGVYDEEAGANVGGVARTMYAYSDNVSSPMTGEIARRVNAIQDRIGNTDETIERLLRNLEAYERRLWAQFAAMEQAMARMQQETEWLNQQLGMNNRQ